jgi:hypothetical protein
MLSLQIFLKINFRDSNTCDTNFLKTLLEVAQQTTQNMLKKGKINLHCSEELGWP